MALWDLSGYHPSGKSVLVGASYRVSGAPFFKDDGTKLYFADGTNELVVEYDLSTAWDVSTATFNQSLDVPVSLQEGRGIYFRPNGNNFYLNENTLSIYQYNLSTPITAAATMAGTSTFIGAALQPITSAATMAGTSTFTALPANITAVATMAGVGALSGVGSFATATKGRAVDEASAGGTSAALSVSLNSAITEPANPTRNT